MFIFDYVLLMLRTLPPFRCGFRGELDGKHVFLVSGRKRALAKRIRSRVIITNKEQQITATKATTRQTKHNSEQRQERRTFATK